MMESNVSMTLESDARRDSHMVFQNTLKNIFEAEEPQGQNQGLPQPEPPQGLPRPVPPQVHYITQGGDESEEEEAPIPGPSTTMGHYAEPSTNPMNDDEVTVHSGHIAAASSASSFHSPYDSLYGRGTNQTAGYQPHKPRMSGSTGSWKE